MFRQAMIDEVSWPRHQTEPENAVSGFPDLEALGWLRMARGPAAYGQRRSISTRP